MEPNINTPAAPAFFIAATPLKWPVRVRMPVDGGEFAYYEFTGLFARLSKAERKALEDANERDKIVKEAAENGTETSKEALDAAAERDNARKLPRYLVGWEGVRQGPENGGGEVPYSVETLLDQLDGPNGDALASGLWLAAAEINNGVRLGNFVPSLAPGLAAVSAPAESPAP